MKVVTAEQMRRIDRTTIEERGIPGLTLMERAGEAVATEALQRFHPESAVILAGKGNNGGDGFVAARHLQLRGVACRVLLFADTNELKGDALAAWRAMPGAVDRRTNAAPHGLVDELERFDVVIDALLGSGVRGPVSGALAEVIQEMNTARTPILAVDIPSGLPVDGGLIEGPVVRANATVTMGLPKLGMALYPGVAYTGAVAVADLGFPHDLTENEELRVNLLGPGEIGSLLPERPPEGHKGSFGCALILAGSQGMTGAAALAARAAVRSGAGLILCGAPTGLETVFDQILIEPVKRAILSGTLGQYDKMSIEPALQLAKEADAVALGPGLSRRQGVREFVAAFCERYEGPLILDADGLNVLGEEPDLLRRRPGPTAITPHPGELSRLNGRTVKQVQESRIDSARDFAERHNVVVVLKGAQTIIAGPDGEITVNSSGNTGLAKGGSGDVLTGLVAGLAAQGLSVERAARIGVFIHGMAADLAARPISVRAMSPSDIIDYLGASFLAVEQARNELTPTVGLGFQPVESK